MMAPRPCLFEHFQRFLKVNQKAHAARTLEQGNALSRPFLSILFSGVDDNADVNDICVLLLTTGNRTLFPVRSRQIQYNHLSNNIRSSHQNTNCSKLRVQRKCLKVHYNNKKCKTVCAGSTQLGFSFDKASIPENQC